MPEITCASCEDKFSKQEEYAKHLLDKHPEDTVGCNWAKAILADKKPPENILEFSPPDKMVLELITSIEKSKKELLELENRLVQNEALLISQRTKNRDLLKTLDKLLELLRGRPQ